MPIFSFIAVSILGLTAGSFLAGAVAAGLGLVASLGLNYAIKALSGKPAATDTTQHFSAQGALATGGDIPRSFQFGYSMTAGSLVYANEWGASGSTPNAYHTQVIALQDMPGGTLLEVWINGELCPLGTVADASKGFPVPKYNKGGADHLWVKYYDGTQTTADSFLVTNVSSSARPYESTRVGLGVAYVICTALVEDTLFTGFPTYKFALSGIPLYDISKDSTAGGSGSHRWSDKTTWGGDGDNLPAVQIYNLLRGITYGSSWLYGLQQMTGPRLPASNWITQINKCRVTVTGETGLEATYRSGAQISVAAPLATAVEGILTSCQGRLAEIGGFYKLHLGAPDSATFSWTDDDILSSEEQHFTPFFGLADSVNGISAKFPFPADGWVSKVAPPYYRTDLEALDGNRRLLANPSFDFVPYSAQVQRLQKSAIQEAQRARRHALSLPPEFWVVEPGDIGQWTSVRNGYSNKQFRVDGVSDRSNLDVVLNITEVDPSDYSWNHSVEFTPITVSSTAFQRPAPQGVLSWDAQPFIERDSNGLSRRPAILLVFDGNQPGIKGVTYQVRLTSDLSLVTSNNTDQINLGSLIVRGLLANTAYQARGQYIPSSPRDMLWSNWIDVTTPNVLLSVAEFDAAITQQVTTALDGLQDAKNNAEQIISSLGSNDVARNFLDARNVRQELSDQFVITNTAVTQTTNVSNTVTQALADYKVTVTAQFSAVSAGILTEQQARADAVSAVAATVTSLTATVNTNTANISSEQTARVNADGALSSRLDTTNANIGGNSAAINQEVLARANGDSALASQITSLTSTVNGNVAAITNESITRANADSSIAANVDNLQTQVGTNTSAISNESVARSNADGSLAAQINSVSSQTGSNSASISTVQTSLNGVSLQFGVIGALDGVTGGFVLQGVKRNDGGQQFNLLIDADVSIRGTFSGQKITAGSLEAYTFKAGTITSDSGVFGATSVKSLSIADNAVTVPKVQTRTNAWGGPAYYSSANNFVLTVDTLGLNGKTITVYATITYTVAYNGSLTANTGLLYINGAEVQRNATDTRTGGLVISGALDISANGGSMDIPVRFDWSPGSNNVVLGNRILFAMAVKR
jgi:hypothetical protein